MARDVGMYIFLGVLIFLAFFIVYSVSDFRVTGMATTEFIKDSDAFDQGETLIMAVSGNFVDQVTRDNILFYEDHVRIPMIYEVKRLDGDFYIYAQLIDKSEGNYSVVIEDVRYRIGTQTVDDDIVAPFTITNNTADFYVSPGFATASKSFSLEIQNLKPTRIAVSIDSSNLIGSIDSLELVSGEIKEIDFQRTGEAPAEESFFEEVTLGSEDTSYNVPVLLESFDETEEETIEEKEDEKDFKFQPEVANISMATNSDSKRIIYLTNTGEGLIENINLSVSSSLEHYVNISPESIGMLNEGSTQKIELFAISGEEEEEIEGTVLANSEGIVTSFRLNLYFERDFIPDEEEENGEEDETIITTCEQLEGTICGENEKCTGETTSAKDGICCLEPGICEEVKESNTRRIIGWSIVVFIILLLAWFFWKYKKARPKADILSFGKKK